ncbi:MAG: DUF423 domain-containing protein [Allorhizobium sp.]
MNRLDNLRPLILLLAGLIGAAGVGLAAAGTHIGGAFLGPAAAMCLAHGPALLALYAGHRMFKTATVSGLVLGLGTLLFAGDMAARQFLDHGLFAMAAPTGGMVMIFGWLLVAAGAFLPKQG